MGKDSSEEKTLPASRKKLRDAREKGQVPKSKDLVTGAGLAASLVYLLVASSGIVSAACAMIDRAGMVAAGDFGAGLSGLSPVIFQAASTALLPLLLLVPATVVLTSLVMLQGVPFALDPIMPNLEKINPIEGFGRLFEMRALIELAKSLLKTALIVTVLMAVLASGLQALVLVPADGLDAELALLRHLAVPMFAATALLFTCAGAIDFGLQRWLFMRDHKMGISEKKRERKDMDGDPHQKMERRRLMRDSLRLAAGLGLKRATLLIYDGGTRAIGLRYVLSEMSEPVVVCRASGTAAAAMLARALDMQLPLAEDGELAGILMRVRLAHGVPEHSFRAVSLALRNAGVV